MAYEIRSESIKTFISDDTIKLPRYQRKQTWKPIDNFRLCISLFKQFPIGVSIFNMDDRTRKGRTIRWLLDGRQRRNALKALNDDPEIVYIWAVKVLGIKPADQPSDLKDKFNSYIKDFLEEADNEDPNSATILTTTTPDPNEDSEVELLENVYGSEQDDDIPPTNVSIDNDAYGINLLLDLLLLTHNKKKKYSGFTKPFDFSEYVKRLPYISDDGSLSSKFLRQQFIPNYKAFCTNEELDYEEEDSFFKFIVKTYEVSDKSKLKSLIQTKWEDIHPRIDLLQRIDELLVNSKIGYIEGINLEPSESKKIFTLLNSAGAKLTYVEILSAKAKWNKTVRIEDEDTKGLVNKLYKEQLGTQIEDMVTWDLPAIFIKKLDDSIVFRKFEFNKSKPEVYNKAINLGFRTLAGIYVGGVSNDSVEQFSDNNLLDFNLKVSDLKRMLVTIKKFPYFKYFTTWKTNLMDLTSDYIAMDFIILAYKDFKSMEENGTSEKTFQKNCFKLWDKLIYEYVTGVWRSASDGRIAANIRNYNGSVTAISADDWKSLLEEIFTSNTIAGKPLRGQNDCKPLLYHMYCLLNLRAPQSDIDNYDIDHIIPQEKFKNSDIEGKDQIMHNILNLGILPKDDNIKKSNYVLSQVIENWAKQLITEYEFIDESHFERFSNVSNYKEMFEFRKPYILKAFDEMRTDLLNN